MSQYYGGLIEDLTRALHPITSELKLLAAMRAYLDESTDKFERKVFAMAAWLAPAARWESFERSWKAVLAAHQLTEFKASACEARSQEFAGWSLDDCVRLKTDLMNVLDATRATGMVTAIDLNTCGKLINREWRPTAYAVCVQYCLVELNNKAEPYPLGEDILCVRETHSPRLGRSAGRQRTTGCY